LDNCHAVFPTVFAAALGGSTPAVADGERSLKLVPSISTIFAHFPLNNLSARESRLQDGALRKAVSPSGPSPPL